MSGSAALSFLAGLVTILVASALGKSRFGPLALAGGIVTGFTLFGFTVVAFGYSLGIDDRSVRLFAGALPAVIEIAVLDALLQSGNRFTTSF